MKNHLRTSTSNRTRKGRANLRRRGLGAALAALTLFASGCQVLTYTGPSGEHFSRTSVGSSTSIAALTVESDTNGLRRVELRGYTNDNSQALGAVTEAAVRAALRNR